MRILAKYRFRIQKQIWIQGSDDLTKNWEKFTDVIFLQIFLSILIFPVYLPLCLYRISKLQEKPSALKSKENIQHFFKFLGLIIQVILPSFSTR